MLMLFGLLSVMVWLVVGVFDFQTYMSAQSSLSESMTEIFEMTREVWSPGMFGPYKEDEAGKENGADSKKIDLMYENPCYLVLLSDDGMPLQVYSSGFQQGNVSDAVDEATKVAQTEATGTLCVGNLYADSYSYYYPTRRIILVVETRQIRKEILSALIVSLLIGFAFEFLLYIACRKAADWMISPIEKTFEKQKQFIADASHELKTPVAVILANAEAMEKDPDPKWLSNIEEEAGRMNGLIADLLDLTRSEQKEVTMVPVDLSRLVEKQCLIQEAVMFEKNIELEEHIEPDLKVMGAAGMLEQLIAILLDNACAHSSGKIIVSLVRRGKDVILGVANTGAPIPPEARERIFERFYRADESRNRSSGRYGLGLAIAKSIVERHKGKIEALCKDGLTTFQVTFRQAA